MMPPEQPRPALPLPAAAATALAATTPTPHLQQLEPTSATTFRGELRGNGETVRFQFWHRPGPPRPAVVLVPILAGGAGLMATIAGQLDGLGYDVLLAERVGSAMVPPQRGPDLDLLFQRTVLHQRLLLAWLEDPGPAFAPPPARFLFGVSVGGIVATATAALEPRLDGLAVVVSGADLGSLVTDSREGRVERWLDWRLRTDGAARGVVAAELRSCLTLEPLAMAAAVPTRKVLLVHGRFDEVVPGANQDWLWEAFGRPQRLLLPAGHYLAAAALGTVLSKADQHFARCATTPRRLGVVSAAERTDLLDH
ncbi:MAG: hypothetical protein JNK49_18220 [Planctomycetes bacterium]|nr:hypothetical protein [Planctomycetota bacterium]